MSKQPMGDAGIAAHKLLRQLMGKMHALRTHRPAILPVAA